MPYPLVGGVAAAETVNVEGVFAPAEIVEGLKAQVRPDAVEQLSEIWPLNPPTALALIMRFAEPPGATVVL